MRLQRTRQSCRLLLSACPMCNSPVTFGSGIMTAYGRLASGTAWKYPRAIHAAYQRFSVSPGS
jgi:hypothetical protein